MKKEFSENGVFEMIAQKLVPKNELSKLSKTQLQGLQILIEKYGGKEVNYELPNVVYSLDWTGFKQEACGEHPEKLLLLLQDYFEICEKEREIREKWRGVLNMKEMEKMLDIFYPAILSAEETILRKEDDRSLRPCSAAISEVIKQLIVPVFDINTILSLKKEKKEDVYGKDIFVISGEYFSTCRSNTAEVIRKKLVKNELWTKTQEIDDKIKKSRPSGSGGNFSH